ncbi:outer-membrane lipoprotein carrier protein LolA [Candidatus Pelagibacter sp.]|jgi:outer membrane lipoprotein-sorting protein|nr:outer-membrane lipoprotein carrier protein LolA [Candidatus Pelagibacter sp.]
MIKYLYILIIFFFNINSNANNKENIINNLKNTKNFNFDFEQNINKKIEKGNCIIEYPKKIYCEYTGANDKILVSNGRSLVIKTKVSYYRYPLNKTPLNFILDKNFLINKIYKLEERIIDNSFINYTIKDDDNEINIFFDYKTFNLIGWQTKDIYQNLNITFLSSIKRNEIFNKDIFKLPTQN